MTATLSPPTLRTKSATCVVVATTLTMPAVSTPGVAAHPAAVTPAAVTTVRSWVRRKLRQAGVWAMPSLWAKAGAAVRRKVTLWSGVPRLSLPFAIATITAASPAGAAEVACHFEAGVITVPAEVAGFPGDYILDTGTAQTTLHETRAHAEGLAETELTRFYEALAGRGELGATLGDAFQIMRTDGTRYDRATYLSRPPSYSAYKLGDIRAELGKRTERRAARAGG